MKLQQRLRTRQEDNMHAMIDVVFLLLIYFLCTVQFGMLELDFNADLSQGTSQQEQVSDEQDFESLRIYVLRQGGYRCNGAFYGSLALLRQRLSELRAVHDARVIIDADAQVVFQDIMAVMDQVTGLSYSHISFAGRQ